MEINKIKGLKLAKKDLEKINNKIKEKKEMFELENQMLFEAQKRIKDNIESFKSELTEQAEKEFKETGEKKLLGGIGIRETTVIDYDDKKAFDWAKNHSLCLKLDKTAFKKIAKTQNIDFVEKTKEIKVTFPKEIKV